MFDLFYLKKIKKILLHSQSKIGHIEVVPHFKMKMPKSPIWGFFSSDV